MTEKQKFNYNNMLYSLREICKYDSSEKIINGSEENYGLDSEEALSMAYDNIQEEAKSACEGVRLIK